MGKNIYNRKKGYRYEQKKKKIKRDVISYEDVPLDDYEEESIELSKPALKRILICVAAIVVLGLIVFAVANRENLTPERISRWITYDLLGSRDTGYPVSILGSNVKEGNFISNNGDMCYVSDTTYQALNPGGNEIGYSQIGYSKPVLVSSGDNILIYNLGGYGYVTGKVDQLNKERETKEEIFTADINSRGDYCVVTKADGYLSKVYAYNKNNERLYAYSFSQYYIYAVAINNNGTGCIACGVTAKGGSMDTVAYVLDFTSETPQSIHSLGENVIYKVEYLESNRAFVVGSTSAYSIDIRKEEAMQIDYNQMKLTAYDLDVDTSKAVISLSRSGDGRQCSLLYVNSKGEVVNTIKTKRSVSSISLYKNRIALLDDSMCYLFDTNGNRIGSAESGNGSKVIRHETSESVYVLGINEIRKIIEFDQ